MYGLITGPNAPGSGLVHDKDFRPFQDGTGHTKKLLLSSREVISTFRDSHVEISEDIGILFVLLSRRLVVLGGYEVDSAKSFKLLKLCE